MPILLEADDCPLGGVQILFEGRSAATICSTHDELPFFYGPLGGCAEVGLDTDNDGELAPHEKVIVDYEAAGARRSLIQCLRERYHGDTPYECCTGVDVALVETVTDLMHFDTVAGADELRASLLGFLFGTPSLPSIMPDVEQPNFDDEHFDDIVNLASITRLDIAQEHGVDSIVLAFHPITSNDRLAIYHEGHWGAVTRGRDAIAALVEEGYTVLGIAMPLRGPNPPLERSNGGPTTSHYALDLDYERGTAFKLYLEPLRIALNWARAQRDYDATVAMGISGGGWTVMAYTALDPSIDVVAPVASSAPLFARRQADNDWGDIEQNWLPLYRRANYLDLYTLSALGRSTLLIYNVNDSCCFGGRGPDAWAPQLAEKVDGLGGALQVLLDDTLAQHAISPFALETILEHFDSALE